MLNQENLNCLAFHSEHLSYMKKAFTQMKVHGIFSVQNINTIIRYRDHQQEILQFLNNSRIGLTQEMFDNFIQKKQRSLREQACYDLSRGAFFALGQKLEDYSRGDILEKILDFFPGPLK